MLRPVIVEHYVKESLSFMTKSGIVSQQVEYWHNVYTFSNGYGASVVNRSDVVGAEVAVLDIKGKNIHHVQLSNLITYDTPITGDVVTGLSPKAVRNLLHRIARLERK